MQEAQYTKHIVPTTRRNKWQALFCFFFYI